MCWAEEVVSFSAAQGVMPLGGRFSYLIDPTQLLRLTEVRSDVYVSRFQRSPSLYPNFGNVNGAVWLRFTYVNPHNFPQRLILEAGDSYIDSVYLYCIRRDSIHAALLSGSGVQPTTKQLASSRAAFLLEIPSKDTIVVYACIYAEGYAQTTMQLFSERAFWEKERDESLWYGIVYGLMLFSLIYVLLLSYRHVVYWVYVAYVLASLGFYLSYDGILTRFALPDIQNFFPRLVAVTELTTAFTAGLVVRKLLRTQDFIPRTDKVLLVWLLLCGLAILLSILNLVPLAIVADTWTMLFAPFAIFASITAWRRGLRFARLYFFGWAVYLVMVLYTAFATSFGLVPFHPLWVPRLLYLSAAIEIVLFVLAIAESLIFVEEQLQKEREERRLGEIKMELQLQQAQQERDMEYQYNAELAESNSELVRLHEEKNELMGIVAHDLKSPISGILGIAEMLKEEAFPSEQQKAMGTAIHETASRMFAIVTNVLSQNALESGRLRLTLLPTNLHILIQEAVKIFHAQAEAKGISVRIEEPMKPLHLVLGDMSAISQVIENLLSNAIKYSAPNSGQVLVRCSEDAINVRLEVHDNGPGISDEDKKLLFNKFQRLSAQPTAGEHSSGLGLNIVQRLVESMNGKVWCESELGCGAAFIVELPRSAKAV